MSRGVLRSLALGLGIFFLGSGLAAWLAAHNIHGFLVFTDNLVAAIASVLVVLLYEHFRHYDVDKLRQSEVKYRTVVELTGTGYHILDIHGRVLDANSEYVRLTGHTTLREILGRSVLEWIAEEAKPSNAEAIARCAENGYVRNFVTEYVDGKGRATFISINATMETIDGSRRIVALCRDVTEVKRHEQAVQQLTGRLINAQEEERSRIARELHDDIGQRIALLSIELGCGLQQPPDSAPDSAKHHRHICQGLSELAKDIQTLSHRLHSSKLEYLGIVVAANGLCNELSHTQKQKIEFIHSGIPRIVPSDISLCLFRVLQEAVQNAVKHSRSEHIRVELLGTPEEIQLTVSDSGIGFDPQDASDSQGLGLMSMHERLSLVGGKLSIDSSPGLGTTISARVPFRTISDSQRAAR
jgi:PAS domain S-box-containing protein